MNEYERLSHTTWDCKYHVVFIPKCRRKTLYQELRRHLGEVFRRLAIQKESKVEEGHLMPDHVHMLLSIPPKYAVSQVLGFIKGKSGSTWLGFMESANAISWGSISGPGILRQHGRARRGSHPCLHPQSREGRSEAGADEPLALTRRLGRLQIQGAASATPSAASSGSNPEAPGFAGGYSYSLAVSRVLASQPGRDSRIRWPAKAPGSPSGR